ncbi:MAG: MATE family efflux transporter [Pseudoflavonifractor sp.]
MREADDAQYHRMTETPIPKLISTLAIPTIVSMLTTGIYNLADTYFVSCLHSDSATGAVGIVFSLMALIQAVGFTLGMGSGSLISRLLGQQKKEEADRVLSSGFLAALLLGGLMSLLGLSFLDKLMALLGATDTILPFARAYAQVILYGAPIMAASFVLNAVLRSEGHAALSMVGITVGGVLNIALDPIFIFVLDLGIAGAAIATVLSQCTSFCILLFCFLSRKSILHLSPRHVSVRPAQYWRIIQTGMPSLFRQGLASIATVALNVSAMAYGDGAVAGMSVVGRVFMMIISVLIGFGQGFQPVMGYNYGARRWDRVRQAFLFTLFTGFTMTAVLSLGGWFAAPLVIRQFGSSAAMLEVGIFAMRAQCVGLLFQPLSVVSNMTFQSIGRSWIATFLSACRQGVFFLPLILILPRVIGLRGVELTQPLSDFCTFLTCIPFAIYFFYTLKAKIAADGGTTKGCAL